jgi:hypothetical protein
MIIFVIAAALVAFYFAWPVSLWVAIGALVRSAIDQWSKREERKGSELRKAFSSDLKDACQWVMLGIATVAIAQLLLQLFGFPRSSSLNAG